MLFVFLMFLLPLQKEHFPEADHPTTLFLHLQHFSVVPNTLHSAACMSSPVSAETASSSTPISTNAASSASFRRSSTASASKRPTTFLQLLAHAVLPAKFLLFFLLLLSTLFVFLMFLLPLQKEHFPEADHPTTLFLHLQHFSVVPNMLHSAACMSSPASAETASSSTPISTNAASSASFRRSSTASASKRPTTFLQLLAHAVLPAKFLLFFVHLVSTLFVVLMFLLPLQKEHFPEADHPTTLFLHLQHFSVVPNMLHSAAC